MNVQNVSLELLKPAEKNVRIHSQKQMQEYTRSIKKFGQTKPIVCDDQYNILAGNGLYMAMKEMGFTEAWCNVISNLSPADKKKLMLADNKIYELGITDHSAIDDILRELDGDFDIPGYEDSMLEMLTMSFAETDDFISSYGTFDTAEIDRIQHKAPSITQSVQKPPQEAPAPDRYDYGEAEKAPMQPLQEPQSENYIICPHCGGKICL
jgi:hypothetical protein